MEPYSCKLKQCTDSCKVELNCTYTEKFLKCILSFVYCPRVLFIHYSIGSCPLPLIKIKTNPETKHAHKTTMMMCNPLKKLNRQITMNKQQIPVYHCLRFRITTSWGSFVCIKKKLIKLIQEEKYLFLPTDSLGFPY